MSFSDMISQGDTRINRRDFMKFSGAAFLAANGLVAGKALCASEKSLPLSKPKNVLLVITDQQHMDTIAAGGSKYVKTPNLDRLVKRGVHFTKSYCTNPVCSPARSSIFSSRTTSETGVYVNGRPIESSMPNLGQWLRQEGGFDTVYAGKWHLPRTYTQFIPGFRVLSTGNGGMGYICDPVVSRACEGYLRNKSEDKPFFMVASFMQPHDICEWLRLNRDDPQELDYKEIADELPELPGNFEFDHLEPEYLKDMRKGREPFQGNGWSKEHWRFYRWSYFRQIEMVDGEIGRVLSALEETGLDKETLVIFTSDHGEGLGHHQSVRKSTPYEECSSVPLVFSWPGYIGEGVTDSTHLASGLDIFPTVCDFVGVKTPSVIRGRSLRGFLEGKGGKGSEFVVTEINSNMCRMLRTDKYKYVCYQGEEVDMLFDMDADPLEKKNLAQDAKFADEVKSHRELLRGWERNLVVNPKTGNTKAWWYDKA